MKSLRIFCDLCEDEITSTNAGFSISHDGSDWLTLGPVENLNSDHHICLNCVVAIKNTEEPK
jgi:hypothetical protein